MLYQMQCCAVVEINGISRRTPEESLMEIYKHALYAKSCRGGFMIFTGRAEPEFKYADEFKQYLIDNQLGNVVESNARENMRYLVNNYDQSHKVKVYIWEVDHEAFDKWYEKKTNAKG